MYLTVVTVAVGLVKRERINLPRLCVSGSGSGEKLEVKKKLLEIIKIGPILLTRR